MNTDNKSIVNKENNFGPELVLFFILIFIFGIIVARFFEGKIIPYGIVIALLLLFLFRYYSGGKNCRPFGILFISVAANVLGFLVYSVEWSNTVCKLEYYGSIIFLQYELFRFDSVLCTGIIIVIIVLIILARGYLHCWSKHEKSSPEDNLKRELFRAREENLRLIEAYLHKFGLICVDGDWGQGKTYLIEQLRVRNKDNYEFVTMKTITYDVGKVLNYVINELRTALDKNKILPEYISVTQKLSSKNDSIGVLAGLFVDEKNTYTILEELCRDLQRIGKPVVLIFEDIDRICSFNILAKIFAVAETLTNITPKTVKVVFECDYEILRVLVAKKYARTRKENVVDMYLEKYLSHRVKLTPMDLRSVMVGLLDDDKREGGNNELTYWTRKNLKCTSDITYIESHNRSLRYLFKREYSIRPVAECMREINQYLQEPYWKENKLEHVLILTFVLKYFDGNIYAEIEKSKSIFPVLTKGISENINENDSQHYESVRNSIADIYNGRIKASDDILYRLDVLQRYGYDIDSYDVLDLVGIIPNSEKDRSSAYYVDVDKMERTYNNYRIDWVVRHVCDSGHPIVNDVEKVVDLFIKDVLESERKRWTSSFNRFWTYLYDTSINSETGNNTIFLMGIPSEIILSRGMRLCKCSHEQWLGFIEFYFDGGIFRQDDILDYTTVVVLRMCVGTQLSDEKEREVFLSVVKYFVKLQIVGNFNRYQVYWDFLMDSVDVVKYYISGHYAAGEIAFNTGLSTDEQVESHVKTVKSILGLCLYDLEDAKKVFENQGIVEEIDLLIEFVKRNLQIIRNDEVADVSYGSIRNDVQLNHEIDDLINSNLSEDLIVQEGFNRVKLNQWVPGRMVLLCQELERRKKMKLKLTKYSNDSGKSGVKAYCISQDSIKVLFSDDMLYTYKKDKLGDSKFSIMIDRARNGIGLNGYISKEVKQDYSEKKQLYWIDYEIEE